MVSTALTSCSTLQQLLKWPLQTLTEQALPGTHAAAADAGALRWTCALQRARAAAGSGWRQSTQTYSSS
jgi:hypothetical protein